jgi:hypothetical protein
MKSYTIAARPDHPQAKKRFTQEVTVILGDDIDQVYEVVEKDFPDGLPSSYQDPKDRSKPARTITWISNFGLYHVKDHSPVSKLANNKKYTMELVKPHPGGLLVYFDGRQVQPLSTRQAGAKIQADLDLGDPPTGWAN